MPRGYLGGSTVVSGRPFPSGSAHPRYVGPSTLYCRICEKPFVVDATQKLSRKLCSSKECRRQANMFNGLATRFQKGQLVGEKSPCWKGGFFFRTYGITEQDYKEMLLRQNGVCAICGGKQKKNRLAVDHSHKTGKVRGLLCFRCNYGLSWFQEQGDRLRQAANYVEKTNSN